LWDIAGIVSKEQLQYNTYKFIQVKVLQSDCLSLQSVSITTELLLQAIKRQVAPFLAVRRQIAPFSSQPTSYSFYWWAMNATGNQPTNQPKI
jgi:hypothetical protein